MNQPQLEEFAHPTGVAGAIASRIGGRTENQDSFLVADTPLGLLVIVCDGMGGGPAGKTASSLASRVMAETVMGVNIGSDPADAMRRSVEAANKAVIDATRENPALRGMGTTCVAVLFGNGEACIAHVGDSRCYQIRDGKMVFRTADHSYVADLVRQGKLTEEEARNSNFSNVITRAIGGAETVEVEIDEVKTEPGDRFALMTDGIWGAVTETDLIEALGRDNPVVELTAGIAEAVDNHGQANGGGHDNLTLALMQLPAALEGSTEDDNWTISDDEDPEGGYEIGDEEPPTLTEIPGEKPAGAKATPSAAAETPSGVAKAPSGDSKAGNDAKAVKAAPAPKKAPEAKAAATSKKSSKWKPYFWVACTLLVLLIGYNVWAYFGKGSVENPDRLAGNTPADTIDNGNSLSEAQQKTIDALLNEAETLPNKSPQNGTQPREKANPNTGTLSDAINQVEENVRNQENNNGKLEDKNVKPKVFTDDLNGVISILDDIANPSEKGGKSVEKRQQEIKENINKAIGILKNYRRNLPEDQESLKRKIADIEKSLKNNTGRLSSINENLTPKPEAESDAKYLIVQLQSINKKK